MGESAAAATEDALQTAAVATAGAVETAAEGTAQMAEKVAETADEVAQKLQDAKPNGETVYRSLCFSCHDMGIVGAPKLGDKEAWAPRIAAGIDTLYASSIKGKNAMPPKGGNPALTDEQVKASVDWMVEQVE
ncbi:MAG: cytochrome c5 family protein [Proteobacteria bacterium]|nr:MAG: cytochrome c5 family protein [Pseudomonadota bacterium]